MSVENSKRLAALVLGATIGLSSTFLPAIAAAKDDDEGGNVIYQKKTTINFEEDTIDGDLTRPDSVYVESRKRVRHSNLIRIREDFREKVLASVSAL